MSADCPSAQGDIDILTLLLARGAEVDREVADGGTALLLATGSGKAEAVRVLLRHGANPARQNRNGEFEGLGEIDGVTISANSL